jgi:hypothetical protein
LLHFRGLDPLAVLIEAVSELGQTELRRVAVKPSRLLRSHDDARQIRCSGQCIRIADKHRPFRLESGLAQEVRDPIEIGGPHDDSLGEPRCLANGGTCFLLSYVCLNPRPARPGLTAETLAEKLDNPLRVRRWRQQTVLLEMKRGTLVVSGIQSHFDHHSLCSASSLLERAERLELERRLEYGVVFDGLVLGPGAVEAILERLMPGLALREHLTRSREGSLERLEHLVEARDLAIESLDRILVIGGLGRPAGNARFG